jgi:hypothetical protein
MAKARHQQRQLVVLVAFHDARADPSLLTGDDVCLVEQHGLADAPQPVEDEAAGELSGAEALEGHAEVIELRVTAGQKRRPRSGPGRVWIRVPIHV